MVNVTLPVLAWTAANSLWSFVSSILPFGGPKTATTHVIVGAYYYPWWDTDKHWSEGYLREKLSPAQGPMLGHYNSRDPAVIAQHLQWAKAYGISLFVASWWGVDGFEDVTIRDYLMPAWMTECSSADCDPTGGIQVALFYEGFALLKREPDNTIVLAKGGANEQRLFADFEYMAETYFAKSNYFKIDGKPVVYIYLTRLFVAGYREVFDSLRSHIQSKYNFGLYLVADEVYWGKPIPERIGTFDAITSYSMHGDLKYNGYPDDTDFISDVEEAYNNYQCTANDLQVDLIPGIIPAFNDRGVRLASNNYVIPHEVRADLAGSGQSSTFWESLHMAHRVLQNRQDENGPPIIMITSWNEFHEDTNIEPTKGTAGASSEPVTYTQGYAFEDYGLKLLELIPKFLQEVATSASSC